MQLDILAFGAHPDDVELSCSGTLIKCIRQGYQAGIIDLTAGEMGTRGNAGLRLEEAETAAGLMKLTVRHNAGIPDGDIRNTVENRKTLIEYIRRYRPEIVMLPYFSDRHPDHENASVLVEQACFYSGLAKIETDASAYRPLNLIYYYFNRVEQVRLIVDISDTFEDKMRAIAAYKSQFYDPRSDEPETFISSKGFMEYIEARARYYGRQIGCAYGEPFWMKSALKIDNLVATFA